MLLIVGVVLNLLNPIHYHHHHHIDSDGIHQEHEIDLHISGTDSHQDNDVEIIDFNPQGFVKKTSEVELPLVFFITLFILIRLVTSQFLTRIVYQVRNSIQKAFLLSPPLRAPPFN